MRTVGKKRGILFCTLALAIAVLGVSCAPGAPVKKEKVIKVGIRQDFVGALATATVPFGYGTYDFWRYIADQGGINGVPVVVLWEDSASLGTKQITGHKRFKEAGVVLEHTHLSSGGETTAPFQERDKIPLVNNAGLTEIQWTKPVPWIFGSLAGWNSVFCAGINYMKKTWTEPRPMRVGIIFYDHPSGWANLEGTPEYCSRIGVDFVGYEVVPLLGAIDVSVELLRLAGKKPDWIYASMYGATLTTTIKDSARLELQKRGIKLMGSAQSIDMPVVGICGPDAENWYTMRIAVSPWETQFPGIKAICEASKKYRGREVEKTPEFYAAGGTCATIAMEGVRLALEKVGIDNLTGAAVRDGLASIKDFESGLFPYLVAMSDEKPWFADFTPVYQVQRGKIVPVGEWAPIVSPYELKELAKR